MGKADLHIHTDEGDGYDSPATVLDWVAERGELDVVAITEHDDLTVALKARELWARRSYPFDFVTGVELTTLQGHLVGLFLETPVPSLRPIEESIEAIHRQGGVCFIPHPLSWMTRSVGPGTFERLLSRQNEGIWPDGIELASGSVAARFSRAKAVRLNRGCLHLPPVGASDAHFAAAIGAAHTEFPGVSASDLAGAFASGALQARDVRSAGPGEVGWSKWLTLPVRGLRATPAKLGWRRTAWSFVSRYRA